MPRDADIMRKLDVEAVYGLSFTKKRKAEMIGRIMNPHGDLLDVGCFYGYFCKKFSEKCRTWGIDINGGFLKVASEFSPKTKFRQASAEGIPFPSNRFDYVLCLDTLEHVKDDKSAIREICRVVKPGGMLIVIVPHKHPSWDMHISRWYNRYAGHLREYDEALPLEIMDNGFHIEEIAYPYQLHYMFQQIINIMLQMMFLPKCKTHDSMEDDFEIRMMAENTPMRRLQKKVFFLAYRICKIDRLIERIGRGYEMLILARKCI